MGTCTVDGCTRPVVAKGLCRSHYNTQRLADIRAGERARPRTCRHCGEPFVGRSPRAVFCSPTCKAAHHLDAAKAASVARRAGRVCVQCRSPIPATASGKAITCSRACGVAYQNRKKQEVREAGRAERLPCALCGASIPDDRPWTSKYCSVQCKRNEMSKRWRERSPGYMRMRNYGVTPEQYEAMLEVQANRCAICRTDTPGGKGTWHVDHCHDSKAVRGLLCHHCNIMLGNAKDDPAVLRSAAAYLENHMKESR